MNRSPRTTEQLIQNEPRTSSGIDYSRDSYRLNDRDLEQQAEIGVAGGDFRDGPRALILKDLFPGVDLSRESESGTKITTFISCLFRERRYYHSSR